MRRKTYEKPLQKEGEYGLILAIFELTIKDYHGRYKSDDGKRNHEDSIRWLNSNKIEPFSFNWCCDIIGVSRVRCKRWIVNHKLRKKRV